LVPAQDAVLIAGRVIAIDADFNSLSGYSAADGRLQWKTKTAGDNNGRHSLSIRRGSVFFWAGDRVFKVDPATGSVFRRVKAPWNDNCGWVEEGSACAYYCNCHFVLADCSTGKQIGANFEMSRVEFHSPMDGSSSSCSRSGVGLVTGTERVAIVTAHDQNAKTQPPMGSWRINMVVLGLDAATGQEIWRSSDLVVTDGYVRAGASPDGRICWGANRDGDLRAFECASGSLLWKKAGRPDDTAPATFVSYVPERGGLFRRIDTAAEVFDLRSGALLWKTAVPAPGAAIPIGAPIPDYAIAGDKDSTKPLLLLRPTDGGIERRVPLPPESYVHQDPAGGFFVRKISEELVAYDVTGQKRWRMEKPDLMSPDFYEDFFVLFDGERIALFDRESARPLGELTGRIRVRPGSSLQNGILLYRFVEGENNVSQAIFARAAPPRP
jgi:outer membrane protein assembly factor BamB